MDRGAVRSCRTDLRIEGGYLGYLLVSFLLTHGDSELTWLDVWDDLHAGFVEMLDHAIEIGVPLGV
jgi:hypothetical protein